MVTTIVKPKAQETLANTQYVIQQQTQNATLCQTQQNQLKMRDINADAEHVPNAAAGGGFARRLAHGDAGLAEVGIAGELIALPEQTLACQGGGGACGSGGHGCELDRSKLLCNRTNYSSVCDEELSSMSMQERSRSSLWKIDECWDWTTELWEPMERLGVVGPQVNGELVIGCVRRACSSDLDCRIQIGL